MAVLSVLDASLDRVEESWYESSAAPADALGRAARKLLNGGALYLGGGVGVEKVGEKFALTGNGKRETHPGPLSAVTAAFTRAGKATATDTPGGATSISDPNAAARLRELFEEEKDAQRDIERLEARARRRTARTLSGLPMGNGGPYEFDSYDQQRLEELKGRLTQITAERKRLLAGGSVEEAMAEAAALVEDKPGTNWKQISPSAGKKLGPLVRHYMSKAHPFRACVNDNRGRLRDPEGACAVLKDYGSKTTKWRKGGKAREAIEAELVEAAGEARERLLALEEAFGEGAAFELAEASPADLASNLHRQIAEMAYADRALLFLMGWMSEEELREGAWSETMHPRDFKGQFAAKLGSAKVSTTISAPGDVNVRKRPDGKYEVRGGGTLNAEQKAKGGPPFVTVDSPDRAAQLATTRSLRSTHPASLGGITKYDGLHDFEGRHGGPKRKRELARAYDAGTARGREVDEIKRKQAQFAATGSTGPGGAQRSKRRRGMRRSWYDPSRPDLMTSGLEEGTRGPGDPLPRRAAPSKGRPGAGERAAKRVKRGQSSGRTPSGKRKPDTPATGGSSGGKGGEFAGSKPGGGYIQIGAEGAPAKAVQGKVGAKTDGKFGEKTKQAVRKFQAKHGLKVDGVVGRQTAAALAGKKGAKNLKTGAMSAKQQQALGGKPKRGRVREGASGLPFDSILTEAPWDVDLHPRGGFTQNRGWFSRKTYRGGFRRRSDRPTPSVSNPGDTQRGAKGPGRQPGGRAPAGSLAARGKPYGTAKGVRDARAARKPPEGGPPQSRVIEFDPPDKTKQALAGMITPQEAKSEKASQPFADGDKLYEQAEQDFPDYRALLNMGAGVNERLDGIASYIDSGAAFEKTKQTVRDNPTKPHVVIAAMKERAKADEKVEAKYGGDWSKLGDVVRGTVLVPRLDDMPAAMDAIRAEAKAKGWELRAPENRFVYEEGSHVNTGPLPSGYRDFSVQVVSPKGVVAELQVNTVPMWIAKDGKDKRPGHEIYEEERKILYRATKAGRALTSQERRQIEALRAEASQLYGEAFADSYLSGARRRTTAPAGRRRRSRSR